MLTLPAIVLSLAFAGGTWLDVPFIKQTKDGCGPASMWMVMQYWNSTATPELESIRRSVFSAVDAGVHAREMERYFTSNGFQTWSFTGDWDALIENLQNGRPLIVALRGDPLHYAVVAGIDINDGLIYLNDPAARKLRAMGRADFEKRWHASNNWALLALPLTPAANSGETTPPMPGPPLSKGEEAGMNSDLEAASNAFRREDYREAKRYARHAQRADLSNATTSELLGTLYLLDENVEAALKYWNRTRQPRIRNVEIDPAPRVDPVVLDRAFAFSRGSVLTVDDFIATKRRLDATRLLSGYTFDFSPTEDDERFDLTLHAADDGGAHYIGWLRGLPYQTLRPQFTNIGGWTMNWSSLLRWDPQKRRFMMSLDGPLPDADSIRYFASFDARNENWDFRGDSFSIRRIDTMLGIQVPVRSRGTWTSVVTAGNERIGSRASLDYDLIRLPEQRIVVSGGVRAEIGRDRSNRFAKGEPSLRIHWLPKARGSDFETSLQLRAGRSSARTPVDELFVLGLDRDNDLFLRAHSSLHDGKKGAGPIGNRYVLLNVETMKVVHDSGLARLSAGPFIDVARLSSVFVDAGLAIRLSLGSSLSFSLSLGKDLRSGHTVGFFN